MAALELEQRDAELLAGEEGEGRRTAMRILTRLARVQGAERFIDVTRAHIDGCIYTGEAIVSFAETLAAQGATVAVPTTTNVISLDRGRWREQGVPEPFARNGRRLADAYQRMGAAPTFTCAPYEAAGEPVRGEHIAWAESNAIAFANGVLGARTNRYGDLIDACAALTGRVPLAGYHLDSARLATLIVHVDVDASLVEDSFWPVLGYIVGAHAGEQVPAVVGAPTHPTRDQLKAFAAAAATSGAVGMFHIVGVTPEAHTLDQAVGAGTTRTIRVGRAELLDAWRSLSSDARLPLQSVVLGSPHLSLSDTRLLAELLDGASASADVDLCITTSNLVYEAATRLGLAGTIERAGGRFVTDTCVLNSPVLPQGAGALMTNSAKYAHYAPGLLGRSVIFACTEDCVRSAVHGRAIVRTPRWATA